MQGFTLLELSAKGVPYLPGILVKVPNDRAQENRFIDEISSECLTNFDKISGKSLWGHPTPPMFLVTLLPDMVTDHNPQVSYLGLTADNLPTLLDACGEQDAYGAYRRLIESIAQITPGYSEEKVRNARLDVDINNHRAVCQTYLEQLTLDFGQTREKQFQKALATLLDHYHQKFFIEGCSASLYIAGLPCISQLTQTRQGSFLTRDISTGKLLTEPDRNKTLFDTNEQLADITHTSIILETYYLEGRQVSYVTAAGKVFVTEQKPGPISSSNTRIQLLTDLLETENISETEYLSSITQEELRDMLHPSADPQSVKSLKEIQGGIAGSPGAAQGKVFFSSEKLLEAYQSAQLADDDASFILMVNRTGREDIQAIERCTAVITSEGGYTSHAPIVARYLGKPAAVFPDLQFTDNHVNVGPDGIEEGTTLTLVVQGAGTPSLFLGPANLTYPDTEKTELGKLLKIAKKHCTNLQILANADNASDAQNAIDFGAEGIGLCRIEHLMLNKHNVGRFRELMTTSDQQNYRENLDKIRHNLTAAFYELFSILNGKLITFRLMDAPLSEFFPPETGISKFQEKNPMLGLRGSRTGIVYPDLYSMQVQAIVEAALKATLEDQIPVCPQIMLPFIVSIREIEILKYGDESVSDNTGGILKSVQRIMEKFNVQDLPFPMKIGSIIELPAAAISAGEISTQVEFLSFGTNDLTQTVLGVSRDDLYAFLPSYIAKGIWQKDPFQTLVEPVKELIAQAVRASRQIRPDLMVGVCGEQGAQSEVVQFCSEQKMNYISCPPFDVPLAYLAAAKSNIGQS